MSATKIHDDINTHTAGFPPAPSEAHQRAGMKGKYTKGDTREVTMNGSFMRLRYLGGNPYSSDSWLVIHQQPAAFTRSTN